MFLEYGWAKWWINRTATHIPISLTNKKKIVRIKKYMIWIEHKHMKINLINKKKKAQKQKWTKNLKKNTHTHAHKRNKIRFTTSKILNEFWWLWSQTPSFQIYYRNDFVKCLKHYTFTVAVINRRGACVVCCSFFVCRIRRSTFRIENNCITYWHS